MIIQLSKNYYYFAPNMSSEAAKEFEAHVPFWNWTNLDNQRVRYGFIIWRIIQAVLFTHNMAHPDEYWQAIEPAYNIVFGGVELPWEWRPEYRLRSTLYPTLLAAPLYLLKKIGMDYAPIVRACP